MSKLKNWPLFFKTTAKLLANFNKGKLEDCEELEMQQEYMPYLNKKSFFAVLGVFVYFIVSTIALLLLFNFTRELTFNILTIQDENLKGVVSFMTNCLLFLFVWVFVIIIPSGVVFEFVLLTICCLLVFLEKSELEYIKEHGKLFKNNDFLKLVLKSEEFKMLSTEKQKSLKEKVEEEIRLGGDLQQIVFNFIEKVLGSKNKNKAQQEEIKAQVEKEQAIELLKQ